MTDSPWAVQTPRATAAVSKPANWGFFLLLNIGFAVVVGLIEAGLQMAANFSLPGIIDNLVVIVGSTWVSGARWLKSNGGSWTRGDRHKLAFSYTMVSLALTLVVLGLIAALIAGGFGDTLAPELGLTPEMMAMGVVFIGIVTAIVLPLVLWAGYGIMRLVLWNLVNKNAVDAPRVADEFLMPENRARLHANWGYFAIVYTAMALAMGVVSVALDVMFQITGSELGLTVGGFIAAAILAGLRYVRQHGNVWTPRERHHLALVYAFTSFVVSAVVMGAASVAIYFIEGSLTELRMVLSDPAFLAMLAFSLAVGLAVYYALGRFALFVVDRAAHAGAGLSS